MTVDGVRINLCFGTVSWQTTAGGRESVQSSVVLSSEHACQVCIIILYRNQNQNLFSPTTFGSHAIAGDFAQKYRSNWKNQETHIVPLKLV